MYYVAFHVCLISPRLLLLEFFYSVLLGVLVASLVGRGFVCVLIVSLCVYLAGSCIFNCLGNLNIQAEIQHSKFTLVSLKKRLQQCLSEPEFCGVLVYRFKTNNVQNAH